MPKAGQSGDQPDFASVYGDDDILTPRLAAHLWGRPSSFPTPTVRTRTPTC